MGTIKQRQFIFLIVVLVITTVLSFMILKGFLLLLALGAVFAVSCQPLMNFFLKITHGQRALAALLTMLVIIACIVLPLSWIGSQILFEAADLYSNIRAGGQEQVTTALKDLLGRLPFAENSSVEAEVYVERALEWLVSHLGSIFGNVAGAVANFLIFLIILYYLLKDGDRLRKAIVEYSPLSDTDDERVLEKLGRAVNSVMRGRVLLAIIQGILAAIGMAFFGVPNAALWGSVTAIAALVPGIGTALVIVPATLYLFWQGSVGAGIGFFVWGIILVGLVDNILGPKLLGRGTALHPLVVLLSVLGGISYFGHLGFLIGPLVLSLLIALLEILFAMGSKSSLA